MKLSVDRKRIQNNIDRIIFVDECNPDFDPSVFIFTEIDDCEDFFYLILFHFYHLLSLYFLFPHKCWETKNRREAAEARASGQDNPVKTRDMNLCEMARGLIIVP